MGAGMSEAVAEVSVEAAQVRPVTQSTPLASPRRVLCCLTKDEAEACVVVQGSSFALDDLGELGAPSEAGGGVEGWFS